MVDEDALIAAAQEGNLDAFNDLVLSAQHSVYNVAYRITGEPATAADATSRAFMSAFRDIDRLGGDSFKSYLMCILTQGCRELLCQAEGRLQETLPDTRDPGGRLDPASSGATAEPQKRSQRQRLADVIQRGIMTLAWEERITLVLSDVQGLGYDEIAEAMGVTRGTVRRRLARARGRLRDYLREYAGCFQAPR
ncbi:MAG: RNA polymerase sigma factor [Chloroflexota bacterium]